MMPVEIVPALMVMLRYLVAMAFGLLVQKGWVQASDTDSLVTAMTTIASGLIGFLATVGYGIIINMRHRNRAKVAEANLDSLKNATGADQPGSVTVSMPTTSGGQP